MTQPGQPPIILVDIDGQPYQWRWAPLARLCPVCGERAMMANQWFKVSRPSLLDTNGGQGRTPSVAESSWVLCCWCFHREKQVLGADGNWDTVAVQDVETIEEEPQ